MCGLSALVGGVKCKLLSVVCDRTGAAVHVSLRSRLISATVDL